MKSPSDLPPGVEPHMIPGNEPDARHEPTAALLDAIDQYLETSDNTDSDEWTKTRHWKLHQLFEELRSYVGRERAGTPHAKPAGNPPATPTVGRVARRLILDALDLNLAPYPEAVAQVIPNALLAIAVLLYGRHRRVLRGSDRKEIRDLASMLRRYFDSTIGPPPTGAPSGFELCPVCGGAGCQSCNKQGIIIADEPAPKPATEPG